MKSKFLAFLALGAVCVIIVAVCIGMGGSIEQKRTERYGRTFEVKGFHTRLTDERVDHESVKLEPADGLPMPRGIDEWVPVGEFPARPTKGQKVVLLRDKDKPHGAFLILNQPCPEAPK